MPLENMHIIKIHAPNNGQLLTAQCTRVVKAQAHLLGNRGAFEEGANGSLWRQLRLSFQEQPMLQPCSMATSMLLLVNLGQAVCHVSNGLTIVPASFEEGQDLRCEGCAFTLVSEGMSVLHARWKLWDEVDGRQDAGGRLVLLFVFCKARKVKHQLLVQEGEMPTEQALEQEAVENNSADIAAYADRC